MRPACRGHACREIPEPILDGVTGILVPPDDPHCLAKAMLGLQEDPTRADAMATRGRERAETLFSEDDHFRSDEKMIRVAERTVKPASSHPAEDQTYPGRHV